MSFFSPVKRLFKSHGILILFAAVFLLIGLGLLGYGASSTVESLASRNWPVTQGTVIESRVSSYVDQDDSGSTRMYKANVLYTYQVGGQQMRGSRVSLGDYSTNHSDVIAEVVNRYPLGSRVNVYYHPSKPDKAVLEPGFSPGILIPLGIGLAFTAVGSLFSVWLFRDLLSGDLADAV